MPSPWGAGNQYHSGEVVIYEGFYYRNIQTHTSQNELSILFKLRLPHRTPALWGRQGRCDEFFKSETDVKVFREQHEEVINYEPHKAKLSHEAIAGAAAFEAAKAWEHHKAKNGEPPKHEHAKEFLAGLVGVAVDRIVETKGLDAIDKHKAKKEAERLAQEQAASNY
ncbi:hypothetical protein FRB96_007078 [Tulasnella sp. 330]|nr:hypothetical protein FRB96_007078 [Tulasnella sp. 330]KAG8876716.1 hypothetical protein FRB97_003976 [Tulasnella sp. 331]